MPEVVAITRDGKGDLWGFQTFVEADRHPIVQYGDPIITGPEKIPRQIALAELPRFLRRIDAEDAALRVEDILDSTHGLPHEQRVSRVLEIKKLLWEIITEASKSPPEDPEAIIQLIRRDRNLSVEESKMNTPTKEAPKTEAKTAEPKAPKTPRANKFEAGQVITLLTDKEGKKYGADNNPKREGTASADRFSKYKDGITVEQALAAGVKSADLDWDSKKGFISIK